MKRPFKLYWFYVHALGGLATYAFTPHVTGLENVPRTGAAIIAANHLAVIDDAVIPLVTPRMVHYMAKEEYFTSPGIKGAFKKFFFTSAGCFPVARSGGSKSLGALEHAREILAKGELFGIHPEGTRSPDGRLYKGHTGVARLAYETGAPIIPVGIIGTNIAQPIGSVMPHRHHVEVHFGAPITVSRTDSAHVTHDMLRNVTDRLMKAIGELSGQTYVDEYAQVEKARLRQEHERAAQEAAHRRHAAQHFVE